MKPKKKRYEITWDENFLFTQLKRNPGAARIFKTYAYARDRLQAIRIARVLNRTLPGVQIFDSIWGTFLHRWRNPK